MLFFNAVVGEGLANKGKSKLGPKGRQEGRQTYCEIADRGVLEWGTPDVQVVARGREWVEQGSREWSGRELYITQDQQVTVKTFLLTLREMGLVLGEPGCHRENREDDIAAIQVRGAAGLIPGDGRQRCVGLWPFLKAE